MSKEDTQKMDREFNKINKDLILRERLALQRTIMANQSTLLAFVRTALYFLVAGLSLESLLQIQNSLLFEIVFFGAASVLLIIGVFNYLRHKRKIINSEKHIGDYKMEYMRESGGD